MHFALDYDKHFKPVLWIRMGSSRIRVQLFTSMRIRIFIQGAKPVRIRILETKSWYFHEKYPSVKY